MSIVGRLDSSCPSFVRRRGLRRQAPWRHSPLRVLVVAFLLPTSDALAVPFLAWPYCSVRSDASPDRSFLFQARLLRKEFTKEFTLWLSGGALAPSVDPMNWRCLVAIALELFEEKLQFLHLAAVCLSRPQESPSARLFGMIQTKPLSPREQYEYCGFPNTYGGDSVYSVFYGITHSCGWDMCVFLFFKDGALQDEG